jgi:N4-gp56 family major capsid protein
MAAYTTGTGNLTDTSSTSLGGTVGGAGLVQAAYDRMVEFALRATPLIRAVADKRPAKQAMPGSSVALQIYKDLDQKTSTLTESQDIDTVSLATPDIVSVSLLEYGNAALTTRKLDLFSLADVDPAVANIIAFNMADSMDAVAQAELLNGTQVIYGGDATSTTSIAGSATDANNDIIRARDIRRAIAKLRANKVVPRKGQFFWCGIHPEVSLDLRAEVGNANWRDPHVYADSQENIWAGEIGAFEGAYFVESPRLYNDATASNANAYSWTAPTTTAIALDGTYATVTTSSTQPNHNLQVGDYVVVSGTTGVTGLNAIYVVDSVTSSTVFKFKTTLTGTVGGTPALQKKTKVYRTFMAGQQALAEAVAEEPHVVIGPVVDRLMRFRPIGWYGVLGFKIYRDKALYRIESTSSIA